MRIKINKIRKICENILIKHGIPVSDARIITDEYIDGELCGKLSHGLQAFPSIIKRLPIKNRFQVEKETESMVLIDAHGYFGQVIAKKAIEIICRKAKKQGVAIGAIKNMVTFLRPAIPARMIEGKGMIGIVFNNGGLQAIAPTGGIDPIFGTNPIGVGIPTDNEPINFDMATSKRAWGEVRVAKTLGKDLPKDTFLNKQGDFTQDPNQAYSVVPEGDYKGYALALLIEILTGSLVDMPTGLKPKKKEYRTTLRGAVLIAIDPSKFTSFNKFKKINSKLINDIKKSRKAKGIEEIRIPGELSQRKRSVNLKNGYFDIDERIINKIKELV